MGKGKAPLPTPTSAHQEVRPPLREVCPPEPVKTQNLWWVRFLPRHIVRFSRCFASLIRTIAAEQQPNLRNTLSSKNFVYRGLISLFQYETCYTVPLQPCDGSPASR